MDVGHASARGMRARNEDTVLVDAGGVALIADGVGGAPDGDRASALAVEASARWLGDCPDDPLVGLLTLPLIAADALALADPPLHPLAATGLAAARVHGGIAYALGLGDCRVSVLRLLPAGEWRAVSSTVDHDGLALAARDLATSLRLGRRPEVLTARAAAEAGRRLLTAIRASQPREPVCPVLATPVRPGDLVLLTTDGVHDALGAVGVCEVVRDLPPGTGAREVSADLVRRALDRGSEDNCSAAVIKVPPTGTPLVPPPGPLGDGA